ncbi:MAG: ABC transporter permease, partial [Planctomycetota bacterium]
MISEALSRIIRHKVRALLMVLTFVLGLASVVSIVGTIEGGRKAIGHDLEALGTDLVALVNPISLGTLSLGTSTEGVPVAEADLDSLFQRVGTMIDSMSPLVIDLGLTTHQDVSWQHTMVSTTPGFQSVL